MANNRLSTLHGTKYDMASEVKRRRQSIENKTFDSMTREEKDAFLDTILKGKTYIEQSNNMIINPASEKIKKKVAQGNYNKVNETLDKLNKWGFFKAIADKKQSAETMLGKTLAFNSLNNEIHHSSQKGGSANESLYSFKQAYSYLQDVKAKNGSLYVMDLETIGGTDLQGIWRPEAITEYSMQSWDFVKGGKDGSRGMNENIVLGIDKPKAGQTSLLDEVLQAISDGTIETNERLRVTANRLSLYGNDTTRMHYDKQKGYYILDSFTDTDLAEPSNIEMIKKGWNRLIEVTDHMEREKHLNGGIRADHLAVAKSLNKVSEDLNKNIATLSGQNHLIFDMPIMQNQLYRWGQSYIGQEGVDQNLAKMFNLNLDFESKKMLDLLGVTQNFYEYKGTRDLYPTGMKGAKSVAGQEYLIDAHLPKWKKDVGLVAHKAADDVYGLMGLLVKDSEILGKSVLDFMAESLEKIDFRESVLESNKHILKAKKRGASYGGKGYINFAMDTNGNVFTASDHVLSKAGVEKESFNVGFGVNKSAIYDITNIQKIKVTDELRSTLADLTPEYSGENLYHLQLNMATVGKYKDSRPGDLTQNFLFKNRKELEAFVSSTFDVIGEKDSAGTVKEIYKEHLDKVDIRQIKTEKGKPNLSDVNRNYEKNYQELYDSAVEFYNNKILTSRAENTFFREKSYDKLENALKLEEGLLKIFKEAGVEKKSLNQREINQIMSANVASGKAALGLNDELITKARNVISDALSYTSFKGGEQVEKLLPSTIDNFSSIMGFVDKNRPLLTKLLGEVNGRISEDTPVEFKREVFTRAYDTIKRNTADYIYRNNINTESINAANVLGDKRLQASIDEFKRTFEIDMSGLGKGANVRYSSTLKPESVSSLVKLDIGTKSSRFNLINSAVNAVYGEKLKKPSEKHKEAAVEKLFNLLQNDADLRDSKIIKDFKKQFDYKNGEFRNKDVNYLNIADTLIDAMVESKDKNVTAGIKNIDYAFMKSLEGNSAFIEALNSEKSLANVSGIVQNITDNLNLHMVTGSDDIHFETVVENSLMKYYMPDINVMRNHSNWDSRKEMLYEKGYKEMKTYLSDVVKGFTNFENTKISVQQDGTLVVLNGAIEPIILDNIPKVRFDDESGVMFLEVGNQNFQYNKKAILSSRTNGIKGEIGTTINGLNNFTNSKYAKTVGENKGAKEGLLKMKGLIKGDISRLREGSAINGFGGNDIDSNYNVDLSEIKNIVYDLFSEDGKHSRYIKDMTFMDKKLQETLKEKLKNAKPNNRRELDNLSPDVVRDMIKDVFHILEAVGTYGEVDNEFMNVISNLGFTNQEKKTANLIAYEGLERPHNSIFGSFDNTQRPPITQSGNAKFLRVEDIKKAKTGKAQVMAGNIISSASMDKKAMRDYAGVGKTTTDVMMDIKYVSSNALDVLLDSNFKSVIKKASVDYGSEKAVENAYKYIQSSISTYEQERIMDSRIHEQVYGLQTAATQKLSRTRDLKGLLADLDDKEYEKQFKTISKHLGSFNVDAVGNVTYKSSIGTYVKRGEKILETKGFADLPTAFASKTKDGIFNLNFYNGNGMKLRDSEINEIIQSNIDRFKKNGKLIDNNLMYGTLLNILEENKISAQFAIEDIGALGYAKTMTSGSEKGMTDILYVTTGKYNDKVKKVFQNIGMWETVNSKVLTNEAIDALVSKGIEDIGSLEEVFKGTSFKTVADLKQAMAKERHINSELLFKYALNDQTHMLANDAIVKHANFGAMYQGSFSKAISLLSQQDGMNINKAVDTIVDLINNNEDFQFMENWKIGDKKIDKSAIGVKNIEGKLYIDGDFLTSSTETSNLNNTKFNNLLRKIDKDYLGSKNTDESLVRKDVWIPRENKDGKVDLEKVDEIVGSFYTTQRNGKTVILGTQSKENVKYVTDVETQTGVTDEYFVLKKQATDLKKKKIYLERDISSTNDEKVISTLTHELNSVKDALREVETELIPYEGTVKITRVGDQELSILNRMAITQGHVDQMNKLIEKGEFNSDILETGALKGRMILAGDTVIGTSSLNLGNTLVDGKPASEPGIRVLDRLTSKIKANQWYDETTDILLDEKLLGHENLKHLKEIYKESKEHGIDIGVEKAEQLYQIRSSFEAKRFNEGYKNDKDIARLTDKGFEVRHINDIAFDAEEIANKNLIVDLGESFNEKQESRYIAVPGTGKTVVEEEIRRKTHGDLKALQNKYEEYIMIKGNQKGNSEKLENEIKDKLNNIAKNVDAELLNKNAMAHNMSKVDITNASYRNKLSGVVGDTFGENQLDYLTGKGIKAIDSTSAGITRNAMIEGKSIAEWEKNGTYFDYTFVSKEQMANMGYFKPETLKQYGFETEQEMIEHLKTNGTVTVYDRFPNTRTGSMVLTRTFLDENLTQNQMKSSISVIGKSNADHDGDSGSNFIDRYIDSKGRKIDGAYYSLVRQKAEEDLKNQGLENTTDNLYEAVAKSGMMEKEDFEHFHNIQSYLTSQAGTDNIEWAKEGYKNIVKDNLKNPLIGDMTNAATVQDGYSTFMKENVNARLSSTSSLDSFYKTEQQANELIAQAQKLYKENNMNFTSGFEGKLLEGEQKAWKDFLNITEVRETNSAKAMDKTLAIFEEAKNMKLIGQDVIDLAQAVATKRVGQDNLIKETVAKTGLAAVGNINLALNSIKLATQTMEKDPSKIGFTNFIWEALDKAEQGIISEKKREHPGFDESKISDFSNAMRDIYHGGNRDQGLTNLKNWMEQHANDVFETGYEKYGKDILPKDAYRAINNKEDGAKAVKEAFIDYIDSTSTNNEFLSLTATFEAIGRNGNHNTNLVKARGYATKGDTLNSSFLKMSGQYDENVYNAMVEENRQKAMSAINISNGRNAYEESISNNKKILSEGISETAEIAMKHTPKIPMTGSGLGMAVLGTAAGLLISGYASGNPLKDKQASQVAEQQQSPKQTMSVPQFLEQGGMVTGNSQGGYVINLQADTRKGRKYMQRMMAQAAEASVGGAVSVNMNLRDVSQNGITDKDIEDFMNRHL